MAVLVDIGFVVVAVPDVPTPAIAPSLAEVALAVEGVTVKGVEGVTVREVEVVSVEGLGVVVVAGFVVMTPADFQLKSTGTAEDEAYRTEE
jgi:hypothetical protein